MITTSIVTVRALLFDMRDRKGWIALGYESFAEYGEQALGWKKSALNQEVMAASIEVTLSLSANCGQIPEGQLRPLSPLTGEERRQVWADATTKAQEEGQKLTAKLVQEAVDRLKQEQGLLEKE